MTKSLFAVKDGTYNCEFLDNGRVRAYSAMGAVLPRKDGVWTWSPEGTLVIEWGWNRGRTQRLWEAADEAYRDYVRSLAEGAGD